MAANAGSDGHGDDDTIFQHDDADTLNEGRGRDIRERMMPKFGALLEPVMTPAMTSPVTMIPLPTSMVRLERSLLLWWFTLTG